VLKETPLRMNLPPRLEDRSRAAAVRSTWSAAGSYGRAQDSAAAIDGVTAPTRSLKPAEYRRPRGTLKPMLVGAGVHLSPSHGTGEEKL
jgi:hypothetical protein